jgi:hypothetical protein
MLRRLPWVIEAEDNLRFSRWFRSALCDWKARTAPIPQGDNPCEWARRIEQLASAARLATSDLRLQQIEARISDCLRRADFSKLDWRKFEPAVADRTIPKAVILKPWISEREKGVVFVSFEYQWVRLLQHCDVNEFARRYLLVVSPTWSPPHGLINHVFPAVYPGPIFCLISNRNDLEIFPRLSPKYVMVPLFASSWVNPGLYEPLAFEKKDIDLLMLANFGKYKRHFALFRALRDLPTSTRVVLIGQHNGARTREVLLAEAASYGVAGRFELRESVSDAEVNDSLRRAKVSVILSRREGSCVAVVESMFANTPVGMYEDAAIGSRVFINENTGRLLKHEQLGAQLARFIAEARQFSPRQWAMDNHLSCFGSTEVLNGVLKTHMLAAGQEWTQDIAAHHWRPDPQLVNEADKIKMSPAYTDLETRLGIRIGQ